MISEFPLLLFTALTGIAGGVYVGAALFPGDEKKNPVVLPLVALILIAAGGLGVLGHVGRPLLLLNIFNNPTSPLTLEGIFTVVFGALAVVDLVIAASRKRSERLIRAIAAIAGIVLMVVVTHAYTGIFGSVAWIAAPTYPLFVVGGVASGASLWLVLGSRDNTASMLFAGGSNILLAIVLAWQAVVFDGLGEAFVLIAAGAFLSAVSAVVAFVASTGKLKHGSVAILVAVLSIAGMAIARYGFYMASVL